MQSAPAALLHGIARTPLAGPAAWACARLARAGMLPARRAGAAARILAAGASEAWRTPAVEVSAGGGAAPLTIACDLRYEQYRQLFFEARPLNACHPAFALIGGRLAEADAVIDVGANAGLFAYAAAAAGARCVHAFEPIPRLAALLRANAARNHLDVIRVHQQLVGSEEGSAAFFVLESDQESTMVAQRAADRGVVEQLRLPVVRLDRFCAREGIDPCRAIFKIDVEGHELAALAGLDGVLGRDDAPDIVVELLGHSLQQGAIERLAARGYQVFYLPPGGPVRVSTAAQWAPKQDLSCWDFLLTKRHS